MLKKINIQHCIVVLMASAFLAFGLYNVHSVSGVTEGGILGMSLLLQHWLDISPSISGFVMNSICYAMGWKILGKMFMFYSILSTIGFSVSYRIFEQFEPLWPNLSPALDICPKWCIISITKQQIYTMAAMIIIVANHSSESCIRERKLI